MSRVVLADRAISDLQAISDYIAQDSVEAAEALIDYLIDQLDRIAATPAVGRERPDIWPGVLCFVVGRAAWRSRFLIFYRSTRSGIEVARIIEGHRNIQAAMTDLPGER